jgi:hypothetical protein
MGFECGCDAGNDYSGDESQWGVREVHKAGKDHICSECNAEIKKGSGYFYHTVFMYKDIQNFKVCLDCQSVIWQFFSGGWMFSTIWDTLSDYLYYNWSEDLPSSCISKLTPKARDKVCDIIQEIHESVK